MRSPAWFPRTALRGAPFVVALLLAACAPAHDAESLFTRMKSPDTEVRQDAAEELDGVIRKGDYQVFLRGLKSPNRMYQVESILFLARMPQPAPRAALRELLRLERRTTLPYNPIRLKPQSMETDSRILVAHLIDANGGDPEAAGVLLQGVGEGQTPEIVIGTCFAVGALRDPKGIPFLVDAARHPDVEVVRAAIQSLGHFHDPRVMESLRAASTHREAVVRSDVLSSLDFQEGPEVVDLLKAVAASDPSPEVRAEAIAKLPRFKDPTVTPVLIEQLKRRDQAPREAALQALRMLTGQSLGPSADAWSRWWARNGAHQAAR